MKAVDVQYKENNILYGAVLLLGLYFCYLSLPINKQPSFLLYSGSLLLSMVCIYGGESVNNRFLGFLLILVGLAALGFPMAFRLPIAIDDHNYMRLFERAGTMDLLPYLRSSDQEKGYLFLNWFLYRQLGGDYNYFQVTIVYFTFLMWALSFRLMGNLKGSRIYMALFIWSHFYFFVLNSGLVRIFMAAPFAFIGLQYIWKGNGSWKKCFLFIVFGALFHLSVLVMLLFLFFFPKRNYFFKNWLLFVFINIFVVFIALISMANLLVPLLGQRYQGYGEIDDLSFSAGSFTTFPIWVICYLYLKNLPPVSDEYKKKYIIGMILLSLSMIFSVAATMVHVGRIIFYSYIGLLILVASIFQLRTRNTTEVVIKCLLIIYSLVYVMQTNMLNNSKTQLFPYKSFLWGDN